MTHEFEIREELDLEATPEQVWEAIATGPGIDSWFMGRNEVEPRVGGRGRMSNEDFTAESTVTAWDPPNRFAFRGDPAPDGVFHAFEYLIEGRDGGSTVLRFVHSGFLGDDWEAEYDALRKGDPVYLHTLGQYLKYFRGRAATSIEIFAPQGPGRERAWSVLRGGLGLAGPVAVGEQVHLTPAGLDPLDGVVDYLSEDFLGVRTDGGLYRFIFGYTGAVVLGHHLYAEPGAPAADEKEAKAAWQSWLAGLLA
jgi:uncharacterized protein YndB with AHSA1/START domain